jgi:hypothetical protein
MGSCLSGDSEVKACPGAGRSELRTTYKRAAQLFEKITDNAIGHVENAFDAFTVPETLPAAEFL